MSSRAELHTSLGITLKPQQYLVPNASSQQGSETLLCPVLGSHLSLLASGDHSSRGRGKMAQEPFLCAAGLAEVLCEHETW